MSARASPSFWSSKMPITLYGSPIAATSWLRVKSRSRAAAGSCWPTRRSGAPIWKAGTARGGRMSISVLALTFILFGGGGFLMGQAMAETWRPWWQILPYGALLAIVNEFLGFALFQGPLLADRL